MGPFTAIIHRSSEGNSKSEVCMRVAMGPARQSPISSGDAASDDCSSGTYITVSYSIFNNPNQKKIMPITSLAYSIGNKSEVVGYSARQIWLS
jgi:hypothetical protein